MRKWYIIYLFFNLLISLLYTEQVKYGESPDKALLSGHADDVAFLETKVFQDYYLNSTDQCFTVALPATWNIARHERCREWLVNTLGFEEKSAQSGHLEIHLVHKSEKV